MSLDRSIFGRDTPEKVLKVTAAERVPGLFDAELVEQGRSVETYWDLTVGQVEDLARRVSARIERVG